MQNKNSLADSRPDLLAYWDYTKNADLDPKKISIYSRKEAWWTCAHGHSYTMPIYKKVHAKTAACSVCTGKKIISGINDFATLAPPEILSEWCYDFNDTDPSTISLNSTEKFWWKCKHGHYWFISCYARIGKKTGCPYCSGREAVPRVNDLYTLYPELTEEWDYERNLLELHLLPGMIKPASNKKVYWKCHEGHSWQATPASRTLDHTGCPYCSGKRTLAGWNDLATLYPQIAAEWNYEKNDLKPTEVRPYSNKTVWWRCSAHPEHEWQQTIVSRTTATDNNKTGEYGCPYCNNRKLLTGFNDLQTLYPDLAEEWNEIKNGRPASKVTVAGRKNKYWWICHICHHEWQNTVHHRIVGVGCPRCNSVTETSFIEQAIYFYLKRDCTNNVLSRAQVLLPNGEKYEVDVLIEPNIAIEYNGSYWHNRRDRKDAEQRKKNSLIQYGYRFISLMDDEENKIISPNEIKHIKADVKWLIETVENLLGIIPTGEIDPSGEDQTAIMAQYEVSARKNSIAERYPEKAATWDYEKNYPLKPTCAFPSSKRIFWWKCPVCGRSYQNSVGNHIKAVHDCPYCPPPKRKNYASYEESVAVLAPHLAKCWVQDPSSKRTPANTSTKSKHSPKVKCPNCNHKWSDHVYNLTRNSYKCPNCQILLNHPIDEEST